MTDDGATVGLVIVSHSARIAEGTVELARQMAATARLVAAGGTDDGGIGTSFDKVSSAVTEADSGSGVVVLCDLGSAVLTAETALDFLEDEARARVRIADAPIVEGTVAAAVAAETGGDLAAVLTAAESANGPASHESVQASAAPGIVRATATLTNKDGLHARPAADLVKLASTFDAKVTVNGVDAKSLLRIMSLGLTAGRDVTIESDGPEADAATSALVSLITSAFGE